MKSEYEEKLKKIENSILTNKDYNKYFEELGKKGISNEEFNIRSSDHIVKLFEVLRVDGTGILSKSAKDNTIMDESTLEKIKGLKDNDTYKENNNNNINNDTKNRISHASNIAENILEYRKTNKIYSTYLEGLLKNGLIDDNFFCYPNYNAIGTRTGRFSSSNPNLQNIPSEVKGLYISRFKDDDNITGRLIQADYSQIELRVAAMYSECKKLIEAFKSGEDIHMATARLISPTPYLCKDISSLSDENKKKLIEIYKKHTNRYSLSDEEVLKNIEEDTKHIRRIAKTINFGIIYGISHYSIAKRLGIDETEAEKFKDNYMKAYPEIKIYMDDTQETARKTGCVGTYFGRIRNVRNAKYFNILCDTLAEECKDDEELRKYFNKENMGYFRSAKNRAERQAINAPIQSTASDFTLLSLISLNHFLSNSELTVNDKTYRPVICGTVHDSIIIDCPDREEDNTFTKYIIKNVKEIMSDPIKYFLDSIVKDIKYINDKEIKTLEGIRNRYAGNDSNCVPIEAEVEVGDNWKDVSSDVENVLNIIFPEASESEDPEF
jgi:DNA polymerase-1